MNKGNQITVEDTFINVILIIKIELIIADELSHDCGVLSHSLRIKEPPVAELRATA